MTLYIAVIGTSDQSCWLPEACKILLLLHADVGGLVNFVKDWMGLHVHQATAAPQPVFERHHVYPVSQHCTACLDTQAAPLSGSILMSTS